jgi:hypothetical protein
MWLDSVALGKVQLELRSTSKICKADDLAVLSQTSIMVEQVWITYQCQRPSEIACDMSIGLRREDAFLPCTHCPGLT